MPVHRRVHAKQVSVTRPVQSSMHGRKGGVTSSRTLAIARLNPFSTHRSCTRSLSRRARHRSQTERLTSDASKPLHPPDQAALGFAVTIAVALVYEVTITADRLELLSTALTASEGVVADEEIQLARPTVPARRSRPYRAWS